MNLLQMLQQGNNPLFQRAIQMTQGKSEEEIKQIVLNVAQERGISKDKLNAMLSQFGYKL